MFSDDTDRDSMKMAQEMVKALARERINHKARLLRDVALDAGVSSDLACCMHTACRIVGFIIVFKPSITDTKNSNFFRDFECVLPNVLRGQYGASLTHDAQGICSCFVKSVYCFVNGDHTELRELGSWLKDCTLAAEEHSRCSALRAACIDLSAELEACVVSFSGQSADKSPEPSSVMSCAGSECTLSGQNVHCQRDL
jgi:hypothetical protein